MMVERIDEETIVLISKEIDHKKEETWGLWDWKKKMMVFPVFSSSFVVRCRRRRRRDHPDSGEGKKVRVRKWSIKS